MTTETKRDLSADLALCEAAANIAPGKWFVMHDEDVCAEFPPGSGELDAIANSYTVGIPEFIAESREGWPESIRRAIVAEAEVERLSALIQSESECAIDTIAENERLRAVLAQIATYGGTDMRGSTCAQTAKDALGLSSPVYDDVTESHRWLKALVSALDDGRIAQTKLSSGTDFVIHCARDHVRKLSTEVPVDATR